MKLGHYLWACEGNREMKTWAAKVARTEFKLVFQAEVIEYSGPIDEEYDDMPEFDTSKENNEGN